MVYRALLTQVGTAAPTAIVLENSLGGTPVWSRSSDGVYLATLTGAFSQTKTWFMVLSSADPTAGTNTAGASWFNANSILVATADGSATAADDILVNFPFEILVYP